MTLNRKPRIMMAKFGLDGHDNGLKIVSKWLRDAGFEVVYLGVLNTPERVLKSALQESADIIGTSYHAGEHMPYTERLMDLLKENKMENVRVIVGGHIPPEDVLKLKEMGVKGVYLPGTLRDEIIASVESIA